MHVAGIGVDTETVRGEPLSFQFFSKELGISDVIFLRKGRDASRVFFAWLDSLPATQNRHYVLFGHNLAFDMISFFWDRHARLREESIRGELWYGWKVEIIYAAVRFAVFRKQNRSITLIDTGAYFVTKLENLAEIFCPNLPKLKMPEGLGQRRFSVRDKNFCAYALRDAEIAYYVGLFLLDRHKEWDVSLCVSAPHFASKVFRKHFLKKTIPLPPRKIIYASMASYHGGKNNLTVTAGLYKRVYALDIKSAYPYAMSQFPSFSNPDLYKACTGRNTPRSLPPFGIYKISGTAKACRWPSLFSHNFKALQGEFSGVWVTGFELNESLRCREVTLTDTFGYYYDAEKDKIPSPFAAYVAEFYARKENAKEKAQREFNKLLMNALYGKFIQTRKLEGLSDLTFDIDEGKLLFDASLQAGGLFNPFIASLITGHTRAFIHRLEHEYNALHTSTDGIQTQKKPERLRKYGLPGTLGSVSIEARGDSLILRNKLYLLYARMVRGDNRNPRILRSILYTGKKIIKYALHGFHSTPQVLEQLWKTGVREYEYVKVNKLRESLRRKLTVNDFVTRSAALQLPGEAKKSKRRSLNSTEGNHGGMGQKQIQFGPETRNGSEPIRPDGRGFAKPHHREKEKRESAEGKRVSG